MRISNIICVTGASLLLVLPFPLRAQSNNATAHLLPVVRDFVPGQVLVQFMPNATARERQEAMDRAASRIQAHIYTATMQRQGHPGLILAGTGIGVLQAVSILLQHPAVEFAEPNWIYRHHADSNDPYFTGGQLWGLYGDTTSPANTFGSHASKAWGEGFTGDHSIYVGVIDEGL
jgi:hypothetical protein